MRQREPRVLRNRLLEEGDALAVPLRGELREALSPLEIELIRFESAVGGRPIRDRSFGDSSAWSAAAIFSATSVWIVKMSVKSR